ncbi:MAG: OprO/OprP family phosphate-selective porin [Planctomycetaceae bacterium]
MLRPHRLISFAACLAAAALGSAPLRADPPPPVPGALLLPAPPDSGAADDDAAVADEPAGLVALPPRADLPPGVAGEIARLQAQIDALRAEGAAADGVAPGRSRSELPDRDAKDAEDATGGKDAAGGGNVAERLGALEKGFGKLTDAAEKKEKADAKKPTITVVGQVQADTVFFGQGPESRADVGDLQDGEQFRRLRIGARGTIFQVLDYSLGVDFALANQPSYLDNFLECRELPWLQNVRFGHYFEPFSLERVTPNINNTFMERSLVDTFAPARNMGAMTYGNAEDELSTWAIGTFRTNSDNIGNDSFDSGQALTMRGTWLPWYDEPSDGRYYLHLGSAYSYRNTSQNQVRFRNTPEIRKQQPAGVFGPVGPPSPSNYINGQPGPFAPIFVDTGAIPARNFQLFDPEFALVLGPLSLQSEYACALVDQIGGPPLFFNGYMAQVSYFLTGEHRPYDRKRGLHRRVEPFENFFRVRTDARGIRTGMGAWEVAGRFSNIVLNDENIQGNNLTDFTIGLNWYLNPFTRWKFNYVRAFLEDTRRGNSLTDAYGMRFDWDF